MTKHQNPSLTDVQYCIFSVLALSLTLVHL